MSLFPCIDYEEDASPVNNDAIKEQSKNWLQVSSFKADLIVPAKQLLPDTSQSVNSLTVQDHKAEIIQPSLTKPVESNVTQSDDDTSQYHHRQKKHKSHSKKHSSKKKRKRERVSRSRSRSPVKVSVPRSKVFLEEVKDLGYDDHYRVDKRPDRDNYSFGTLNKKHISKYRTHAKVPLGLTRAQAFRWRKATQQFSEPIRYHSKSIRKDVYEPGSQVESTVSTPVLSSWGQFVGLPPIVETAGGKKTSANPLGILDSSTVLWTQGKAPKSADADVEVMSSYLSSNAAQKIAAINSELREDSGNTELWLKLISAQDGLLQQRTEDGNSKLFTHQNIIDKKLAIIEQAIKKNPGNLHLKLKKLELSGKILDWQELSQEWKNLTFTHINDIDVWRGYLNHVKNSFANFTVGVMQTAYTKCIKSLRQVSQGMLKSHPCQPNTVEHMIEILLELCDLLNLANCTEKAVAIVQSMIEFNLYRPSSLDSHEAAIESFQEFYDSGVPRFGEPGSKGWCNVGSDSYTVLPAPLKPTVEQDQNEEENILTACQGMSRAKTWLSLEKSRQTSHWLPWKPSANESEDDCEDPHRLVISDDFVDLLFYVEDDKLRSKMYFNFLNWLGLHSHSSGSASMQQVLAGVNQLSPTPCVTCHTYDWQDYILHDLFMAHCTDQIFHHLTREDKSNLIATKLYHQLDQVKSIEDSKQRKLKGKELKRYAKSILSLEENRNNSKLWLCYADCIRELGFFQEMSQVYDVLLGAQATTSESADDLLTPERCEIWWNAVQGEITQNQPLQTRILSICCWLVCGGALITTPSASLKLLLIRQLESQIQELWEKIQEAKYSEQKHLLLSVFSMLLLCNYMSVAVVSGEAALEQAVSYWSQHEFLIQDFDQSKYYKSLVKILKYVQQSLYVSSTPLLRSVIQSAIGSVPDCTTFLQDYVTMEQRSYAVSRTRQFFTSYLASNSSSDSSRAREKVAIYSMLFELQQLQALSSDDYSSKSVTHRIRSVCEKCLNTFCSTSVLLWRLYMSHEAKHGDLKKVESIFYSSVQACPYAKYLYTDAITYLPHKIEEILAIAEEKDVRVHTPLDELDILLHQE